VVWVDYRSGETRGDIDAGDIYGAPLGGGAEFSIATGPADQRDVDIDGGIVVWQAASPRCAPNCHYDIRGRNLATGGDLSIATSQDDEQSPSISRNLVAWRSKRANGTQAIELRDLQAMTPAITLAVIANPETDLSAPVIDGQRVAWGEIDQPGTPQQHWRLMLRTLGTGAAQILATGNGVLPGFYDLHGDILVYQTLEQPGPQAHAIDLHSGMRLNFEDRSFAPTTDGRYVFYGVLGPIARFFPSDLVGYDVQTQSRFVIADRSTGYNQAPQTRNGFLVWSNNAAEGAGWIIYSARVGDVLPSGRRSAPTGPNPDATYFAETGHTLAFGFKAFWSRSGGLPVFGYPLTEEFDERNRDTGKMYTVQYVERQRYEYHPENANTPYTVLLGRLGVEELQRQGRDWQTFPKADPNAPHYFAQTGHAVAPRFWDYWRSHGLEFGDRGVTEREALALFGYPISEPQMEQNSSGDRVLTQWFERARFEYHPNNPEPYTVLLGRLAADLLAARQW
jgi:hypothetical protein